MSLGFGKTKQQNQSTSKSVPLTPQQVQSYFDQLDSNTNGRLSDFAQNGTNVTDYTPLTAQQIQNVGGMGATRLQAVDRGLNQQLDQISNNSALTYAQRQRSNQLANDAALSSRDAINQEIEANVAALMQAENQAKYNAQLANNQLTMRDLELLANIFFGGKGQVTNQQSTGSSGSFDMKMGLFSNSNSEN